MNAVIWYNKMCKTKQLMPKYINIKINKNNMHNKNTKIAATKYRLNQEIRFLYCKQQKLNEELHKIHLECANYCNNVWQYIPTTTNSQLDKMIDYLHHELNKKTERITRTQISQ
jgi:predicted nuclease with TOPRIM domain